MAQRTRNPDRYRKLKGSVCDECGFAAESPAQLDVHHKDGDWTNNDAGNLLTLCANCHRLVHNPASPFVAARDSKLTFSPRMAVEARTLAGLGQREAARKLGIARQTLVNLETDSTPGADTLGRMAFTYGVEVDFFFERIPTGLAPPH